MKKLFLHLHYFVFIFFILTCSPSSGQVKLILRGLSTNNHNQSSNISLVTKKKWAKKSDRFALTVKHLFLTDNIFLSSSFGYCYGGDLTDDTVGKPINGLILRTTDEGTSWISAKINTKTRITSLAFKNLTEGWSVNENSEVFFSLDSGKTWSIHPDIEPQKIKGILRNIYFLNRELGIIYGSHYNYITQDGGKSWAIKSVEALLPNAFEKVENQKNNLQLLHQGFLKAKAFKQPFSYKSNETIRDVQSVNDQLGWIIAEDYQSLNLTSDGGTTWKKIENSHCGGDLILRASFSNVRNGFIITQDSKLFKTTDGGNSWQKAYSDKLPINNDPINFSMFSPKPGKLLTFEGPGKILELTEK